MEVEFALHHYAYRRTDSPHWLWAARHLAQQVVVFNNVPTKAARFDRIYKEAEKMRGEQRNDFFDKVMDDKIASEGCKLGKPVRLPNTYTGSPRNMQQKCLQQKQQQQWRPSFLSPPTSHLVDPGFKTDAHIALVLYIRFSTSYKYSVSFIDIRAILVYTWMIMNKCMRFFKRNLKRFRLIIASLRVIVGRRANRPISDTTATLKQPYFHPTGEPSYT